ncbi:MAG: hypothetical protein ACT4OJ_07245, partial [Bacteroidota bacterium]
AAAGTGAGGYFTGGTTALRTLGGVQLTGIGEAPNRILATVPGTGQATWEDPAGLLAPLFWSTTGNAGTVDGINFIGTTDNIPFNFRVNNLRAGKIDQLTANTSLGYLASDNMAAGTFNSAFGYFSLNANTNGFANTGFGALSLRNNTTGNFNSGLGFNALPSNTTGNQNTGVGVQAMFVNTTGGFNTAVGTASMNANITGSNNIAMGNFTLSTNSSGNINTALGTQSLQFNSTGSNNVAVGAAALNGNTVGSNNTALGTFANVTVNNLTNATAIGFNAQVSASNSMVLGNGANVGIGVSAPVAKLDVENINVGMGAVRVNQDNELVTPAVKALSAGPIVNDLSTFGPNWGDNSIYAQRGNWTAGTAFGIAGHTAIFGFSEAGQGLKGISVDGVGSFGSSSTSTGVHGRSQTGTAVRAQAGSAAALAFHSSGNVRMTGIGEANGAVLTSDAVGNATWQGTYSQSAGISLRQFTAVLSIPSGVSTPITQWAVIVNEDGGSNYNNITGEYTVPVDGVYQINAQYGWNPFTAPDQFCQIRVHVNGGFDNQDSNPNPATGAFQTSAVNYARRLTAGSTVQIQAFQNSGVNQTIAGGLFLQTFSVQFLHR